MKKTFAARRALTVSLASLVMLVSMATAAWAPKYLLSPTINGDCISEDGEAGTFALSLNLTRFEPTREGGLNVAGTATGTCNIPGVDDPSFSDAPFGTSVTVGDHGCETITLELGSYTNKGTVFDLTQDPLVLRSFEVGRKLCAESHALDRWADNPEMLSVFLTRMFL